MSSVTYLLIGLCLPVLALCSSEDALCCFQSKVYGIQDQNTDSMQSFYINTEAKWALKAFIGSAQVKQVAYDLDTNTAYEENCQTYDIPEGEISKLQCIDGNAQKQPQGHSPFFSNNDPETFIVMEKGGLSMTMYEAWKDGDQCTPKYAEFYERHQPVITVEFENSQKTDLAEGYFKQQYDYIRQTCAERK